MQIKDAEEGNIYPRIGFLVLLLFFICKVQGQEHSIDIWAEEFEPLSFQGQRGEIAGMNTELVEAIVKESGVQVRGWQIAPWARAFKEAKENPNALLYSVVRTPEREAFFHWIGPISNRKIALYKLKSRENLNIDEWQDLRKMRIGSLLGSASSETLKSRNLKLYELSNLKQIVKMLLEERIDLANMMDFSLAYLANAEGINFSAFEQVWIVDDTKNFYIAVNINTSEEIVNALQQALSKFKQDGRLALLHQKYLQVSTRTE